MACKRCLSKKWRKFIAFAFAAIIACALSIYIGNFSFFMLTAIAIMLVSMLYLLYAWIRAAYEMKEITDSFVDSMYMMLFYKSSNKPLVEIIKSVASRIQSSKPKAALKEAAARIELGEQFGSALSKGLRAQGINADIDEYASNDWYIQISNFIDSYSNKQKLRISELESSMQRHSTINMFISSVAPSFIIFMFIGNLIISGNYNIILIAVLLLFALPFAYALGIAISTRRLLEVPI